MLAPSADRKPQIAGGGISMTKKTGSIVVTVITGDDKPLAGAEVSVAWQELIRTQITDKEGRASFAELPAGGPYTAAAGTPYAGPVEEYELQITADKTAKAATKGAALEAACRELGITRESVVAFGDAENDLEMFRAAGQAVAMGQAHGSLPPHVEGRVRYVRRKHRARELQERGAAIDLGLAELSLRLADRLP